MANWKYRRNDLHGTIVLNASLPFIPVKWVGRSVGRTDGRFVESVDFCTFGMSINIFSREIFSFCFGFRCGGCCCCDSKSYWNQTPHTTIGQTREERDRMREHNRDREMLLRVLAWFGLVMYALWVFFVVVHRLYTVSTCWTGSANYTYYCQYLFKQGASKKTRSKRNHLRGFFASFYHKRRRSTKQSDRPTGRPKTKFPSINKSTNTELQLTLIYMSLHLKWYHTVSNLHILKKKTMNN